MPSWTDPLWLADVHAWIHEQLQGLGRSLTGSIEQPHVRPWSTVLRVPTADGDLWFKANMPVLAYEAGVVSVLARRRPELVPAFAAVDLARGWMLMVDGGARLREVIERERDLRRWLELLPHYAQLQIDVAEHADEFIALGAPDRRLATLASQYEQLLDEVQGLAANDLHRLRQLTPRVKEMCDQLAGCGIPETIQHDDFHDGQVFVQDGRYLFFDWGDACVSHPFFTMAVTLEGQLAWGLADVEESQDVQPYRDAYLKRFTHVPPSELIAAHTTALRLGWICRALNWHRCAAALEPPFREEHLKGAGLRLQLFLERLP